MIRATLLILMASSVALGQNTSVANNVAAHNQDDVAVVRSFLPPNCQLAEDYAFDFRLDRVSRRWPAVLNGHFFSPASRDIAFAYYCPQVHVFEKTLFLVLLHRTPNGFVQVYAISYRSQVLFSPQALRAVQLKGLPVEAVAIVAAMGAALGGRMDIYVWNGSEGWQNIFPLNGSVEYFYFFPRPASLLIALSPAHRPGLNVSPPPVWYRWTGQRFMKIPPPKGSSKWPLPD
ncbi:MAG: hypothetical protein ACRD11_03255 [Terriglobia bacterium]